MMRFPQYIIGLLIMAASAFPGLVAFADTAFDPGLAPFALNVNGIKISHRIAFHAVLPGEALEFSVGSAIKAKFTIQQGNSSNVFNQGRWLWHAPQNPATYSFRILRAQDGAEIVVQVFVMQRYANITKGDLNHYKIGHYPAPLQGLKAYSAPVGFIEVFEKDLSLAVSPHFQLGQFLCKQESGYPKYIVLLPKLLEKLEYLLAEVNDRGMRTDSFTVMSGYRTPYYNKAIGNVANSRHIFGGAADVFIDVAPMDGVMDDLNQDGRFDEQDAALLYKIFDTFVERTGRGDLLGGVGQYAPTASHGAFVHVDVRGKRARWGH